ncbi:MAG: metal-dependent transcriptional regulator [Actinomycetota bacterium]
MSRRQGSATEDYLKALYMLEGESSGSSLISTTALAQRMGVSAASATNMLKKLAALRLVKHQPYKGAELSGAGRRIALEVIRHHRLLETYLAEALGMPWDEVHDEAEILEHFLSESLEDRIAARLGHPTADPHGHPIPAKDGSIPPSSARRLWEVELNEAGVVDRVSDDTAEGLRYLGGIGLRPGASVEVVGRGPVSGPLFVRIDGSRKREALSREMAEAIWVS